MGGGGYAVMLELTLFLGAQWLLGRLFRQYGAPAILAEIFVGVVLGPEMLNIVPYALDGTKDACSSSVMQHQSILVLIGNMGVALMIFESGMHLHFDKVAEVGRDAFIVACIGTLTPVALGVGTGALLGFNIFPDCLSVGIALAPTSVGIALNMLNEVKFLNSTPGQIIITAAFVDDILSLVMLVILVNIAAGEVTALSICLPLVLSFAFVAFGVWLALHVMPEVKALINRVAENRKQSLQPRDEVHILLMASAIVFFGWLGSLLGSHLLGTFVAGVSFANVPRSGLIWGRQLKRIVNWMMRLFFSATIGFAIPVDVMFTPTAFWKGLVVTAIPTVIGKLVCGAHLGNFKWLVGWAMVARGEFGFLVLQTAKDTVCESCDPIANGLPRAGLQPFMLAADTYAALVWAMLWSTILAPVIFNPVLKSFMKKRGALERANTIGGNLKSQAGQRFVMRLVGQHHTGILHEVMDVLHACELDVLEANAESDDVIDVDRFVVVPRVGGDLDDEKLDEIAHRVKEAINDDESQVIFEPLDLEEDLEITGVLQIRLIGDHHPDILHEIFDMLADERLDVVRAIVDEHHAVGEHGGHHSDHEAVPATSKCSTSLDSDSGLRKPTLRWPSSGSFKKKKKEEGNLGGAGAGVEEDENVDMAASEAVSAVANGTAAAEASVVAEVAADTPAVKASIGQRKRSLSWRGTKPNKPTDTNEATRNSYGTLKETETIYAKMQPDPVTGKRKAIDAIKRARLRTRISGMLEDHHCHGEAMLRMVAEEDAHEAVHPITAINADDHVSIVTVSCQHHPDIMHEIMDALATLALDVLHADISQPNSTEEKDTSTFYIRNVDPDAAIHATDRQRRRTIRSTLSAIFAKHNLEGVASVRPLQQDRPDILLSRRISAGGEALVAPDSFYVSKDAAKERQQRQSVAIVRPEMWGCSSKMGSSAVGLLPLVAGPTAPVLDIAAQRAAAIAEKPLPVAGVGLSLQQVEEESTA